jgi:hypothetical protein
VTVTELKEELQKLEDQGHGDSPVRCYDRDYGWFSAEVEFDYSKQEVQIS